MKKQLKHIACKTFFDEYFLNYMTRNNKLHKKNDQNEKQNQKENLKQ